MYKKTPSILRYMSIGNLCPRLVHSMPKACSLDAQGLFTRCPRLVHPMPKACSSDARMTSIHDSSLFDDSFAMDFINHGDKIIYCAMYLPGKKFLPGF